VTGDPTNRAARRRGQSGHQSTEERSKSSVGNLLQFKRAQEHIALAGRYRHRHTCTNQRLGNALESNTVWSSNDAGGIIGNGGVPWALSLTGGQARVYLPATVALVFGAPHFPDTHGSKLGGDSLSVSACTLGMHFHSQRASMVELSKLTHRVCVIISMRYIL